MIGDDGVTQFSVGEVNCGHEIKTLSCINFEACETSNRSLQYFSS